VPEARVLFSKDDLAAGVERVGREISDAYPNGVLLVAVLKGSIPFLADMVRAISVPVEVDFLAISKYAPDSGRARIVKDLEADILGRDVVLVEDIIDTGLTLTYLLSELGRREPRSLETCALLDKSVRRIVPTPLRFRAFEVADEFVLGYGLDFAERYRNLDEVVAGDMSVLRDDPDAYVGQLYRG
jgi:hypoxanthine phosphoribosyltransferase